MNRYPDKQAKQDGLDQQAHGRVARLRPGARLKVRGFVGRARGPEVLGVALITKVVSEKVDAALVATREYGRRWFHTTSANPFTVVEELG